MNPGLSLPFLLMALLSACGGTVTLPAPTNAVTATAQGQAASGPDAPNTLDLGVTAVVLETRAKTATATLKLAGPKRTAASQPVSLSVDSAPAGVSVRLLTPDGGLDGLTLRMAVQASGPAAQGDVWLSVDLGGQSQRVRLPVLRASSVALPAGTVTAGTVMVAGTVPCGPDLLLYAPVNAPLEQRTRLLSVNRATQTIRSIDLGLAPTEGVTSLLCVQAVGVQAVGVQAGGGQGSGPAGDLWMTLHSGGAQGSVIAHLLPDGTLKRFPVGAVGDTINTLTRTPGGHLWFLQYSQARLGEFDPTTGQVSSHPVGEHASSLGLGQDGALYYSQFYANPAVVRFDPATGGSSTFGVGAKALPRASVQTGGAVWFVDAWNQTLSRLDPVSRQLTQATLPAGAVPGELVAALDGTLWVSDASRHVLYRFASGSLQAMTVPLLNAPSTAGDGPRALSVDAAGVLWYESAGQLISQQ